MRALILTIALALASGTLSAQTAAFKSLTKPCPSGNGVLGLAGVPKLGGSFTAGGIMYPSFCTRRFCGCNPGVCNKCGGSALILGLKRVNIPWPGGCFLQATPDVVLTGDPRGQVTFQVPNSVALNGFVFYLQRMDMSVDQIITPTCATVYAPTGFRGFSDLVEGTIGK